MRPLLLENLEGAKAAIVPAANQSSDGCRNLLSMEDFDFVVVFIIVIFVVNDKYFVTCFSMYAKEGIDAMERKERKTN